MKGNGDDISWVTRRDRGDEVWWELRDFVAWARDPETFHATAQCVGVQIEDSRCAVGTLDDASALSQRGKDVLAFHISERGQPPRCGVACQSRTVVTGTRCRRGFRRMVHGSGRM